MTHRKATALRALSALLVVSTLARAEPPEGTIAPRTPPSSEELEAAKTLFRQGNELRRTGDCTRAAELFLRSMKLVPSVPNTLNAAYCLARVGRGDEALELYEELLTVFRDQLSDEQRGTIGPALAELRGTVGGLFVSANVDGTVVVDGLARGRLPLAWPVRLAPGRHLVRVLLDGWETWESSVEIVAGKTAALDARLAPLAQRGKLRVETDAPATVLVDGATVGTTPWEGTLAPGQHLVAVRTAEGGSAPRLVSVVEGRTVRESIVVEPVGADVSILSRPPEALIRVDGVPVGNGRWVGFLPRGAHRVDVTASGYLPQSRDLDVSQHARAEADVTLEVDAANPIWDARRAELAARGANRRTADELGVLYVNSVVYGVQTGIWLDYALDLHGPRELLTPVFLGAGLAVGGVALADAGTPLRYGVPQSIVSGGYIGMQHGLAWVLVRSEEGAPPTPTQTLGILWGATTAGAAAGGVVGRLAGTTPGRAAYVGTTTLWTGLNAGLVAGALSENTRTGLYALAFGLAAGTATGIGTAGLVSPSTARVRFLDLGGLAGGLVGAGAYAMATEDSIVSKGGILSIAAGSTLGIGVAAYATRNLPRDERPGIALVPGFAPAHGGGTLSLSGTW